MLYAATATLFVFLGGFAFQKLSRAGYESAEYKVVSKDGEYEIREYPDLMVVATKTKIDAQGRDGSFMRLFRYISGRNESEKKIAMTTPVFMESVGEESGGVMEFVMPKDMAADQVPAPVNEDVTVKKRPGGRFAVLRFSGRLDSELAKRSEAELRRWMERKGLTADDSGESGGVEAAAYDPPFTPSSLRRNEILIRLK